MIPIRFGAQGKQKFGLYSPPTGGSDRGEGIVFCNPFGQEAIRCHRLLRVLAERLSRNGYHVLRFDYFGTGDSDGDDTEGDLHTWIGDVLEADEQVRRRSSSRKCSWFGLRLGATIAAMASARSAIAPNRLVLWNPVVDGSDYPAVLARAQEEALKLNAGATPVAPSAGEPSGEPLSEALGFPLTPVMHRQLREVSEASFGSVRAAHVTLIGSATSREMTLLPPLLGKTGASVRTLVIGTEIEWATEDAMNTAIVPAEALQAIVASLSQDP